MIQTASEIFPLRALVFLRNFGFMKEMACNKYNHVSGYFILVALICTFSATCGAAVGAAAASKRDCYRKACGDAEYDIRKDTCCENQLYPGEGLSCCGGQAFNPEEATCCKGEDGDNTAAVTVGLSEKVSRCCGLKAYNPINELCCQSTVVDKRVPMAECCGTGAYDNVTELCCNGISILPKKSNNHLCCGESKQFDPLTECCSDTLEVEAISSSVCQKLLPRCGTKTYNSFQKLCCQSTIVDKHTPSTQCCDEKTFDEDKQLCCGRPGSMTIQTKKSSNHLCCGRFKQFEPTTECCSDTLEVEAISSSVCQKQPGVQRQKPASQPTCTEPETSLCGSSCYNPSHLRCCESNQGKSKECCPAGPCADVAPAVYNPRTHVCCDGCISEWKPRARQLLGSTGQHRCGMGVYSPDTEICCDGHRHHKNENTHCCGVKAYDVEDKRMKCCAGKLYNLTSGHEAQCCGSTLLTPLNVCCSSDDMEVLYSAKTGFGCCGHQYYNASLWSCCAGTLSPVHRPGQHQSKMIKESRLLSVNNLKEADLCEEMKVGIVESVSPHSVVFSSVLKINGRNGIVTLLASPHILETSDHCSIPKLIPGKTYFFDKFNVFTDFNHNSIVQSLHFIRSKCYRPGTTTG